MDLITNECCHCHCFVECVLTSEISDQCLMWICLVTAGGHRKLDYEIVGFFPPNCSSDSCWTLKLSFFLISLISYKVSIYSETALKMLYIET